MNKGSRTCSSSCIDHVFSESMASGFTLDLHNQELNITDHNAILLSLSWVGTKQEPKYKPAYHTTINYINEFCIFDFHGKIFVYGRSIKIDG